VAYEKGEIYPKWKCSTDEEQSYMIDGIQSTLISNIRARADLKISKERSEH
jgi:hypothetical protein